ncbi:hypothetical protein RRF57_012714 [Xylaria bambusicola]|uniref:Uncharacterized protein n=1 Tax=Xylaria bambusicola TaxID=326684 RepID=A0AAN7UVN0_9PEZI
MNRQRELWFSTILRDLVSGVGLQHRIPPDVIRFASKPSTVWEVFSHFKSDDPEHAELLLGHLCHLLKS